MTGINYSVCRDAITLEQLALYPIRDKAKYAALSRRVARDLLKHNKQLFATDPDRYTPFDSRVSTALTLFMSRSTRQDSWQDTRLKIFDALDYIYRNNAWMTAHTDRYE